MKKLTALYIAFVAILMSCSKKDAAPPAPVFKMTEKSVIIDAASKSATFTYAVTADKGLSLSKTVSYLSYSDGESSAEFDLQSEAGPITVTDWSSSLITVIGSSDNTIKAGDTKDVVIKLQAVTPYTGKFSYILKSITFMNGMGGKEVHAIGKASGLIDF